MEGSIDMNLLDFKSKLIDALLACLTMRDRHIRDDIIDDLPDQIKNTIKTGDIDKTDVMNIVKRCQDFTGGIEKLIESVRYYEGASRNMEAVDKIIASLQK